MALKENVLYKKIIFRATRGQGKRRKSGVGSKSPSLQMWLERSPGNGSGMVFQIGNRGLDPQEQALRTNSVKHRIEKTSETSLRVLLASLKQHVILSVDVGSLSRENIGSGTTGLYVYTGSLAEGMVRVYRQVFRPSSHTKCRVEKRRITWDRSVKDTRLMYNWPDITVVHTGTQKCHTLT